MQLYLFSNFKSDLKDRSYHQSMWKMAAPMILSNMTIPLVGLVDSAVMGHLDEVHYLAAVGLASALFTFIIWTMGFLRMITTGLVAQSLGRSDNPMIRQWLYLSAILSLIISSIILLINPWLIELILWWIEGEAIVEEKVIEYWNIRIYGLPVSLLNAVLIGWYLGMQNARLPFIMLIVTNATNIILDLVFVNYGMDVDGVALASVIAESLGLLIGLAYLPKLLKQYPIAEKLKLAWHKLLYLLNLNKDLLIRTLALEAVFFTIHARGSELGAETMAINAIILNFLLLVSNGLDGMANAVEAKVGKALGEQSWTNFRKSVVIGGFWSLAISVLISFGFLIAGQYFVSLITDISSLQNTFNEFWIYSILIPLVCVASFWLDGIFIGASAITTMRNSMIIALLIGFIPLYFLSLDLDNHGIWLAFMSFMMMRAMSSWYFFKKGLRKGRYIELKKIYL